MRTIVKRKHATAKPQTLREETDLIMRVIDFLNRNGYCVWRAHNSGHYSTQQVAEGLTKWFVGLAKSPEVVARLSEQVDGTAYKTTRGQLVRKVNEQLDKGWRKVQGGRKGVPDILGFRLNGGKMVGVEVKIGLDELSNEQKQLLDEMRKAGCEVWLVRSFDSFVEGFCKRYEKGGMAPKDEAPSEGATVRTVKFVDVDL